MSETAAHLQFIDAVFQLTVADLARVFGVSRQAIYDWRAGKTASFEHAERARLLANAAELFAEAKIAATRHVLHRPIERGLGFIELAGVGDPEQAARALISVLRTEAAQRKLLQERLAGRDQTVDWGECGAPALDERD